MPRMLAFVALLFAGAALQSADPKKPALPDKLLFDFEEQGDVEAWANLELPDPKSKEPAVKFERSADHASAGKHSLKMTFAGGRWPTITTTRVPDDWMPYQSFHADVTVKRPCLVGFTVLQEKSRRFGDWDGAVSRWCKTELLQPGANHVVGVLHPPNDYSISAKHGKVVRFEIFMYTPHEGESIWVDNIRLSADKVDQTPPKTEFKVLGTDLTATSCIELGKKLKDRWTKPEDRTVEQIESAFRAKFDDLKKTHPKAVLAVFRDGDKGFDPAQPDKVFDGWKDAYWSSHGPDGMTIERTDNRGKHGAFEVFMRHRSPLYRVELGSIPKGADILAAQFVLVRSGNIPKDHNPYEKPTMWVAEPCKRPWVETEVNAYEFARDKFWKRIGGMYYGDDPDFLPFYLAHGPGQGKVNAWDFTHAVRFWTDGKRENHGFMMHGDSHDYMNAWTREAPDVKNRPALLVIYEPK